MKKIFIILALIFLLIWGFASVQAASSTTVCCETTTLGIPCQDVAKELCAPGAKQVPTACSSTSYCKPGTCFSVKQGTCLDNTPQKTCNPNDGIWKETPGPECELGCCILGDQAAFVTLTRCKWLSGQKLKIDTVFKREIKDEATCIASVLGQEKGACIFESEFTKNCRIMTRSECAGGVSGTATKGEFFKGKLCTSANISAVSLCGETDNKICVSGKEEVYSVDSCGNPSNIYATGSDRPGNYWEDILDKNESCKQDSDNIDSATCGNCNYLAGSICRTDSKGSNAKCTDLNCYGTKDELGGVTKRLHGESWCVASEFNNAVGSRYYKKICINGEVLTEQCDDYRQQVCINQTRSFTLPGSSVVNYFSQAACRVNRWQTCTSQTTYDECTNSDVRDCNWVNDKCVPLNAPGLKFWEGTDAQVVCGQASKVCLVRAEKKWYGGLGNWKLKSGSECAEVSDSGKITIKSSWMNQMGAICNTVGDCGVKNNWLNKPGKLKLSDMFTKTSVKD